MVTSGMIDSSAVLVFLSGCWSVPDAIFRHSKRRLRRDDITARPRHRRGGRGVI